MSKHILIIEDETAIQNVLKELLKEQGYTVTTADDGLEGIQIFQNGTFDLVLLDIMMPKIDGYAVCEMIRSKSSVPVILLTALDDVEDQIRGFDLLADDYITKPFSLELVLRRISAVLRRRTLPEAEAPVLIYKNVTLNTESYQVFEAEKEVYLTRKEFDILELLLKNQGRVFSRDALLNHIWGYDYYGDEKTVNIHIMNLRRKLHTDCIETVRGVGYRIAKENPN